MTNGDERGRGILTPQDRTFLRNPDEYSRQATYNRRKKIRERVKHSVLDVPILVDHASDELIDEALMNEDGLNAPDALPELISFLYQIYGSEYQLERAIEEGVERARRKQDDAVIADVSITLFPDEHAEIEHHLEQENYEAIDHRDIEELWRAGYLSDDEYLSAVERWEQWWKETQKERLKRNKARRKVVLGAFNRAQQLVNINRGQEKAREKMLDDLGIQDTGE